MTICEFCGKENADCYCQQCFMEIDAALADLASLKYKIEWGVRTGTDRELAESIRRAANRLQDAITELIGEPKDEI